MKNKKAEIIEIILITILISLGINLISSSIFVLDSTKNIIIMIIGIILCISVVIYYLKTKVKSMNIDKTIDGNIILNVKNKQICKSLEYHSSYSMGDYINAIMLEKPEIRKKYNDSLKKIENFIENESRLKDNYFVYLIESAIEYKILNLFTDYIPLNDKNIKIIDLENAPDSILNNVFIKILSEDYKNRNIFDNYKEEILEDSELFSLRSDEGFIYNKFKIAIPKKAKLLKKDNSLTITSKIFKLTIDWNTSNFCSPFSDMAFYNFFSTDTEIDIDDIEVPYYINIKVEYTLLSMFSKKANNYYLWIKFIVNQLIDVFDFNECLKKNNWNLIKNINKL